MYDHVGTPATKRVSLFMVICWIEHHLVNLYGHGTMSRDVTFDVYSFYIMHFIVSIRYLSVQTK